MIQMKPARPLAALLVLGAACVLAPFSASAAQPAGGDSSPIEIALVSEAESVIPGQTFTVAIHQKMKPGYHTYWRNPGTIGLPTSIEWTLPDGFTAGEIQWPIPEMTRMAAYNVWGYEKEALLLVDITAPTSIKPGASATLKGKATWMCCGKQCHPGFDDLKLALRVGGKPTWNARWRKQFDLVRSQQPRASDLWKIKCSAKGDNYTLSLSPQGNVGDPGGVRFFDYDRQISSDKPQRVKRKGDAILLRLQQEEHTGEKLNRLRGILVAESSWGKDARFRALEVDVPIARRE